MLADKQIKVLPVPICGQVKPLINSVSRCYLPPPPPAAVSSSSAEGASGFCRTMPPSERQLMSIGASEHRAFVRAKARFAGQKAQEHSFVRRNAVFTGHCPSRHPSVQPARSHSLPVERHLPGLMQRPPLPGVSLFRRFCCYLDRPPALQSSPRPSPPQV